MTNCFGDAIDMGLSRAIDAAGLIQDFFGSDEENNESYGRGVYKTKGKKAYKRSAGKTHRVSKNLRMRNVGNYRVGNGFYRTGMSVETNPLKLTRSTPILKKSSLFPKERIKSVDISPDGRRVAYLYDDGNTRYIKMLPSVGRGNIVILRENHEIKNFAFIGNNLVYIYYDDDNNLKAKVRDSSGAKRALELPDNLKSIRFFKGVNACLAECFDGEKYLLYKISMRNFECKEVKELLEPIHSIFDKDLRLLLVIKKENGQTNVYVKPKKSRQQEETEQEVNDDILVESIENDNETKYISADNTGACYKVCIQKPKNIFTVERINPNRDYESTELLRMVGIFSLSMCKVNLDQNMIPSFVTVNSGKKYRHYPINDKIKRHLNNINRYFTYSSWYRISTTSDGMLWLICAQQDKMCDRFFLYDVRTEKLKNITVENVFSKNFSMNEKYLKSTECHFIPSSNGDSIQIFLTRGVNHTLNSPTVIMTNSSGQYNWGYSPIIQVLANRGYNVVCINCNKGDLSSSSVEEFEDAVSMASCDIAETVQWLTRNNIVKQGNIVLLAKKHSVIPAMQVFSKNQRVFGGYIALSSSEKDINLLNNFELGELTKPVLVIGRLNNSEAALELKDKLPESTSSIVSSNNYMGQQLITGIIETFLAKKFHNPSIEKLFNKEVESLNMLVDGLNLFDLSDDNQEHNYREDEDFENQYNSL